MKKRMKRITAAAAACLLSLIFAACGSSSKSNTTEDISTGQAAAYDAGGVYSNYSAEMEPEEAAPALIFVPATSISQAGGRRALRRTPLLHAG